MPKVKPHKATLKRIKITGGGKVKFNRAGKSHLNSSLTGKRNRQLRSAGYATPADIKRLEGALHRPLKPKYVG